MWLPFTLPAPTEYRHLPYDLDVDDKVRVGLGHAASSVGTLITTIAPPVITAMSSSPWFTLLAGALTLGLATWYFGLPLLVHAFGNFSVTRLTPYTARGVEWRHRKDAILPTVRVERADWRWGGMKAEEVGIVVLTIEGVSVRVKAEEKGRDEKLSAPQSRKTSSRSSRLAARAGSWMLHVVIHHHPILARIISIRISDIRIIADDLSGLECIVEDIQMGAAVRFGGRGEQPIASGLMSPPMSPVESQRNFASPMQSPPSSPLAFTSFLDPFASSVPISPPSSVDEPTSISRFARLSQAKRKATQSYVAVTSTASQAFARAIGRSHGSISLNVAFSDIAIILPHEIESPDAAPTQAFPSLNSLRSLPSLIRKQSSKPARFSTTNEAGYSTLASVKGVSTARLGLGFRPGKGLLAEDTLTAVLNLAAAAGTIGGVDKMRDLLKKRKEARAGDEGPKTKMDWSATAMPRIVLRALESASITIATASITQNLPKNSRSPSASSSATDITLAPASDEDAFALSLEIDGLGIVLNAADSSTNAFAKNTFGEAKNPAPESRIRGIGFGIQWTGAAIQCISPGEAAHDKTQLFAIRRAEFEGLSTWRPNGWSREELLFAEDPNISLIIGTGNIASVDITADLQLVDELKEAVVEYSRSRSDSAAKPPPSVVETIPCLPPRVRLGFSVGPMMVAITDKIEEQGMTISMASDGCSFGCFTSFEDIVGRRKPADQKRIFKEEEDLYQRREEAGDYFNAALPNAMHRPQHRRNAATKPAVLDDDLSFRLVLSSDLEMQPISVHLNIDEPTGRTETYEMVSIGRVHGRISGSIAGQTDIEDDGSDTPRLDLSTRSINLDIGVEDGATANLWEPPVIKALAAMGAKRQTSSPPTSPSAVSPPRTLLDRLPPGISFRLSLEALSVFIGHPDPNPNCKHKLIRGLWVRTEVLLEHAFYTRAAQYPRDRARVSESRQRATLKLREDVTAQAIAYSEATREAGGRAALTTVGLSEMFARPIYNGEKFDRVGGVQLGLQKTPYKRKTKSGLDKGKAKGEDQEMRTSFSSFQNDPIDVPDAVPPPDISKAHQAQRPLIRLSEANANIMLQQDAADARTAVKVTGKLSRPVIDGDMSHVYCVLVMNLAIRRISSAWRRPTIPTSPSPIPLFDLSASIKIPALTLHFAFPLRERITLDVGSIAIDKPPMQGYGLTAGRMMLYVRSPEFEGMWEELGRVKDLRFTAPVPAPGEKPSFDIGAECFRLRIPHGYKLADIILNVNVSVKSLSTLLHNFRGGEFWTKHQPRPEQPKIVPHLRISIQRFAVEAMDAPLETKLKIIFRAGLLAQERRVELEDMLESKLGVLEDPESAHGGSTDSKAPKLSAKTSVSMEEARYRLDWQAEREWIKRHEAAVKMERGREGEKRSPFYIRNPDGYLDIKLVERAPAPPLFRILYDGVKLDISSLAWTHEQTVKYMSDCSITPFDDKVQFSLIVPLNLKWTMDAATFTLRDYPLPLVRIRSSDPNVPPWSLETPFIIGEDYHGPETWFNVPTEIVPADLGESGAAPLHIEVYKTISPVKTYTQPTIKIQSDLTSEFAWGNAIQPAIQDMMKIMDTITHSPKDPSDKPGFWDKLRLILQWRIQLDFAGPVHLHHKGASDPYTITGHGAGFAFAWRHGTTFRVGFPNSQYELIQAESEELMVVIPDLTAAEKGAAVGETRAPCGNAIVDEFEPLDDRFERAITREYTKPCARFVGGIRIGFGFVFERTCRPWNCTQGCGDTEKLGRRHCRFFDFKKHQDVILRNAEAVEKSEHDAGHSVDSFEGFRSDYIHFSVSCVSTKSEESSQAANGTASNEETSALHFTPKASAHFGAWWHTFNSALSLPIRKGALFPNSPPPSKKFGRHLGTIKYRMDLSDVYVSHVYNQVVPQLWSAGKSQYLGLKGHFGRVQADGHQRLQERIIRHEKLNRIQVLPHKVFYAVDILLDDVVAKGIIAEFVEAKFNPPKDIANHIAPEEPTELVHVSELSADQKAWYSFFDYIDADRKPFDHNPKFQVVDLADCPQLSYGKRSRAQAIDSRDDDSDYSLESSEFETTKFGHEETHICNLGGAPPVATVQIRLAEKRMAELLRILHDVQDGKEGNYKLTEKDCKVRISSIQKYVDHLRCKEDRHMTGDTLQSHYADHDHGCAQEDEDFFRNQVYVHSPRIVITNTTRKLAERYFYSRQDRVQEERMVSNTALQDVRRSISRIRHEESVDRANPKSQTESQSPALDLQREIENLLVASSDKSRLFRLPSDIGAISGDRRLASMGIPVDSGIVAMTNISLFKPQIVLRSEIDGDSIVLLAVEEIAFKGYDVNDAASEHRPAEQILSRNYVFFKGLQAFYPTEENVRRSRAEAGTAHSLGFLPLEIFLDDKNEAKDYHRIVSKTDAGISVDMFNRLRLPRGVEWPDAKDDNNMPIEHLRIHQDLFNVVLPRMTVSGTSKHYAALYNIATDLLLYQDPRHAERSKRIDSFLLAFDRKDRDPHQTILDLYNQQQATVKLNEYLQWFETRVDDLTNDDKCELFNLRNELLEHMEQLFTVFDAIAIATKREKARASQVHSSRVNIMAGGIAWRMQLDNLLPLIQFDIDGTIFSYISNKDGSTDQALRINDLSALNSSPDAHFTEVFTRLDVGGSKRGELRKPFASGAWSVANPVGGIPIVKELRAFLHPIRIALEERIAHQIVDYIFPGRAERHGRGNAKERRKLKKRKGSPDGRGNGKADATASSSTLELPPLARSKSAVSVLSQATGQERSKGDEKYTLVSSEDADIMRERAAAKNFHFIEVMATVISLSYKSDTMRKRKNTLSRVPDCVDLRVRTPALHVTNRILTISDFFDVVKTAFVKDVWSQSGSILGQLFYKTSLGSTARSRDKRYKSLHTDIPAKLLGSSKLTYEVEYPAPESGLKDEHNGHIDSHNPLKRVLSRKSPRVSTFSNANGITNGHGGDSMSSSPTSGGSRRLSVGRENAARDLHMAQHARGDERGAHVGEGSDEAEEELYGDGDNEGSGGDGSETRVGKVKGFLGRLGRKRDHHRKPSVDDLRASPSGSSVDRRTHRSASSSSSMSFPIFH